MTELQERILARLTEDIVTCTYPAWLEKRMLEHQRFVESDYREQEAQRTQPMKKIIHEQFYAGNRP